MAPRSITNLVTEVEVQPILIFGIYTGCQLMEVNVRCNKFECQKDIHFERQPGAVAKNAT